MIPAGHQTMMAKAVKYPWDYRVEYIDQTYNNRNAYFYLNIPVPSSKPDQEFSVVISTASTQDRKLFGQPYTYGISTYSSRWRPTGYNDWKTGVGPLVSSYPKIRFVLKTTGGILIYSPDGTLIHSQTTVTTRYPGAVYGSLNLDGWLDGQQRWMHLCIGRMADNGDWLTENLAPKPTDTFASTRIYDFYLKDGNEYQHHLIPCVMGGVAGFYDEAKDVFRSSSTANGFIAGPRVADDYKSYQV